MGEESKKLALRTIRIGDIYESRDARTKNKIKVVGLREVAGVFTIVCYRCGPSAANVPLSYIDPFRLTVTTKKGYTRIERGVGKILWQK